MLLKLRGLLAVVLGVGLAANGSGMPLQQPENVTPSPATQGQAWKPAGSSTNVLPEATPVRMRLNRTISSADAQVGENVDFETLDDVKVGDQIVIPQGSTAIATITTAVPKKRMAKGGQLAMNIDYVRLPSGEKVPLRGVQDVKGGGHTGAMAGGMVASAILFWPAAPFFLLMHGKDVTIPKGHEVTVYTNSNYALARPAEAAPAPLAPPPPPSDAVSAKTISGPALTNADILKLKSAGLGDAVIISKIMNSAANYHLEVDDLVNLKKAGLSEEVISAMMQASHR